MKLLRLSGILALVVGSACSGGAPLPGIITGPAGVTGSFCPAGFVCLLSVSFQPVSITVERGHNVGFINDSGIPHSVIFDVPRPALVDDIALFTTGTNIRVFNQVGRFPFHCAQHAGMTGEIIVTN